MHEHDGHGALADGRGDPLGRLGPGVAGDEHAGDAGLEVVRAPFDRPDPAGWLAAEEGPGPAIDEAVLVARRRPVEPVGARGGADEDEQPLGVDHLGGRRSALSRRVSCSRCSSPLALDDLGAGPHGDVVDRRRSAGSGSTDIDVVQRRPAHQDGHRAGDGGRSRRRPGRPSWHRRRCRRPGRRSWPPRVMADP